MDEQLARVVAVMNGKGGVLKTSISTNVAAVCAEDGMRVLLMNLDLTSGADHDLGLGDDPRNDAGKGVVDAIWHGTPFPVAKDVRPGLDYVFGGWGLLLLDQMMKVPSSSNLPGGSVSAAFRARMGELAGQYDLVLLDCPPGNAALQQLALECSRWVLIPTKTDKASREGLLGIGPLAKQARAVNPGLDYLGLVITANDQRATRLLQTTRETLTAELGGRVPLFQTSIRFSEKVANDCREEGLLVHEMARRVESSKRERLAALAARRAGEASGEVSEMPKAVSETSTGLAADYRALATELCERLAAGEAAAAKVGRL